MRCRQLRWRSQGAGGFITGKRFSKSNITLHCLRVENQTVFQDETRAFLVVKPSVLYDQYQIHLGKKSSYPWYNLSASAKDTCGHFSVLWTRCRQQSWRSGGSGICHRQAFLRMELCEHFAKNCLYAHKGIACELQHLCFRHGLN